VVCPAYVAQQPLNPKYVILDLRDYMTEVSPKLRALPRAKKLAASGENVQPGQAASSNGNGTEKSNGRKMVGDIIKPETLWACDLLPCVRMSRLIGVSGDRGRAVTHHMEALPHHWRR
jgi:hypothetical protein